MLVCEQITRQDLNTVSKPCFRRRKLPVGAIFGSAWQACGSTLRVLRCPAATVALLVLATHPVNIRAEDVVVVRSTSGGPPARATGEILEYTGKQLRLRRSGGTISTIPTSRVIEVLTEWPSTQVEADRLFAAGQYAEALPQYLEAVKVGDRTWVRRKAMAQAVWCSRYLIEIARAGDLFLLVVRSDPATQYFDAIPLSWRPHEPHSQLERRALIWLEDRSLASARLLGASWLLSTNHRGQALKTLHELQQNADFRVSLLAAAQIWRTEVATAAQSDVDRWGQMVAKQPEALRAGSYMVLGRARSHQGAHQEAAIEFMRVPILYPRHRTLAAECLLAAGRELELAGESGLTGRLYREIIDDYSNSPSAAEAAGKVRDSSD